MPSSAFKVMVVFMASGLLAPASVARAGVDECPPQWEGLAGPAPGVTGAANAAIWWDDGSGMALFLAHTHAPDVQTPPIRKFAKFDGTHWIDFAINGDVNALTIFDDGNGAALYAAGSFTTIAGVAALRIARWNGVQWSPVGAGFNGVVRALTAIDAGQEGGPRLIAGGEFTQSGSEFMFRVASWDTTAWSPMWLGMSGAVWSLAVWDDGTGPAIYAGGQFNEAGAPNTRALARWTGTQWAATGALFAAGDVVRAIQPDGDSLVVGGDFKKAAGAPALNVARLSESGWSPMGAGLDAPVFALTIADLGEGPVLCAGGAFMNSGGTPISRLAQWDGSSWSEIVGGADDRVTALAPGPEGSDVSLTAGGDFIQIGGPDGVVAVRIASLEEGAWRAYGQGFNGAVRALAVFDDGDGPALFVGGDFTTVGNVSANHIARWDGVHWTALGSGVDGEVLALAVHDDGSGPALYVGGPFTTAGGVAAKALARWDGSAWSSVGVEVFGGTSAIVRALRSVQPPIFSVPSLMVAGDFSFWSNDVFIVGVARWTGEEWKGLPPGLGTTVQTFATHDTGLGDGPRLYAGGAFSTHKRIAMFAGQWQAVGGGVPSGTVYSTHSFAEGGAPGLFVGGSFTQAGPTPAAAIARWDGAAWNALGGGMAQSPSGTPEVRAMAHFDDGNGAALYAGGKFSAAGGVAAMGIARWDGAAWHSLESKFSSSTSTVYAMVEYDDGGGPALYIGGSFNSSAAGDSYLTRLVPCSIDPCPLGALGDLDCNGAIDGADLTAILGAWGPCAACAEDLNDDGVVDGGDLAIVLGNWTG